MSTNSYSEVKNKLEIGKDLVKFTINKDYTRYALVTSIYERSNGVYIKGLYKDNLGNNQEISKIFYFLKDINNAKDESERKKIESFNNENLIKYKNFATTETIPQTDYIPNPIQNGIKVFSHKQTGGFSKDIINSLIGIGSELSFNSKSEPFLVTDVYPGGLRIVNSKGKYSIISNYDNIS
jgi:hypothetical protein